MRNLSVAELLTAWERTLGQSPVQQALVLLAAAYPEYSLEQLAQFSVGQRDAYLLTLRERLFGSQLNSVTACPQCQQRIELAFNVHDIRVEPVMTDPSAPGGEAMTLTMEGYRVHFRLPNSLDLVSIETSPDVNQAREQLLRRCIQSVVREGAESDDGEPLDNASRLPMTLVDAMAERMAQEDAQADTRLALSCPDCRHEWRATFDIATYLVGEIHHWVHHVLREVHGLARAYGWREADILAMTPTRRRVYLELLEHG
jgi:hypothetical protein